MESPRIYLIILLVIDTSNIITNLFIIYALRKLGKQSNISFWFIYCLSISDCLVGLSGFTSNMYYACCHSVQDFWTISYAREVKDFFIAYSFRLTTVIAIDRSIRMKYLNRYSNVMTKKKAYLILTLSAVLGLVQFAGCISLHRITFELVFIIFHFICITFSCVLYTFTYCNIKQQVRDAHLNLRRNVPIHDANVHVSALDQSVSNNEHECAKESTKACNDRRCNKCHGSTAISSNFRDVQNEGYGPSALGKSSSENEKWLNHIPQKSTQNNSPNNEDNTRSLNRRSGKVADDNVSTHGAVIQSKVIYFKDETSTSDSNDVTHRNKTDSDIGKAMLLITFALILFYFPMFIEGILLFCDVNSGLFHEIAVAFIFINSSSNAVILTIFSSEIRNVAKSLLKKH